jgi:hypothetical protein
MNAKELYNQKLLVLATMSGLIEKLRDELANLTTIEDRFPVPDHSELYGTPGSAQPQAASVMRRHRSFAECVSTTSLGPDAISSRYGDGMSRRLFQLASIHLGAPLAK